MTKSSPVFRPVLIHAWRILWRYPWVFFFGFFASFLGVGSFWELLLHTQQTSVSAARIVIAIQQAVATGTITKILLGIPRTLTNTPGTFFLGCVFFLAIGAVFLLLLWGAAVSHSALIDTTVKKTLDRRTTIEAAWAVGRHFSFRVLGIHLCAKGAIGIAFVLSGITIAYTSTPGAGRVFFAFLFLLIFIALSLTMTLVTMYASAYSVIRGFTIRESFHAAFILFHTHWLISLECATLFFLCSLLLGFCAFLALLLLTIPFVLLFMIVAVTTIAGGTGILLILWLLLALLVLAFTTSLLAAWQIAAWTLLFLRLTNEGATAKLIRLTERVFPTSP